MMWVGSAGNYFEVVIGELELLWYAYCCVSIQQWYIKGQSTQQRFETQ
jgi:hypothetical protein